MALLAMLATAPDGERTRSWLQDRLWGTRQKAQAQQSLRRELTSLRASLQMGGISLISADRDRVKLDLSSVQLDDIARNAGEIFLEGFDLPDEEGFEDWLREQRQRVRAPHVLSRHLAPALPRSVVDLHDPTPGFGGKPAIAVLPFQSAEGFPAGDIWAEGMTDDLVERLSRLRWLPVIAPSSMVELRNLNFDAPTIGNLVGASYILRGRLVLRAGALSLQLNLLDTGRGQLLWSERFAMPDGITPHVFEDILEQLVALLEARIDSEQQLRVLDRGVDELNFDECVWRARWHLNRLSRKDAAIAQALLATALEQRPNSADVLIQAAFAKAWDVWSGRRDDEEISQLRLLALRAVAADGYDGRGHMLAGMAEMWMRNHEAAHEHFGEALRLNPSLARAHAQLGSNHYLAGRPEAAFKPLRTALRLSPLDSQVFYVLGEIAIAHCMLGDYGEAIRHANLAIARRPAYFYAHVCKINALARSDRQEAAARALAVLYRARPGFQPADIDWLPFRDASWNQYLKQGIALAEGA